VLPAGRLREPIASAAAADAVIMPGASTEAARALARRLGIRNGFSMTRSLGPLRALGNSAAPAAAHARLYAVAGIGRPERFFSQLEQAGFTVVGTRAFKDHHQFDADDLARIEDGVHATGADAVVTTEKDAVRLEALSLPAVTFMSIPLTAIIEPREEFAAWLIARLLEARQVKARVS
jgi:tetraacyldisaccharide 4'-kinase